jgi:hypothetical protein
MNLHRFVRSGRPEEGWSEANSSHQNLNYNVKKELDPKFGKMLFGSIANGEWRKAIEWGRFLDAEYENLQDFERDSKHQEILSNGELYEKWGEDLVEAIEAYSEALTMVLGGNEY